MLHQNRSKYLQLIILISIIFLAGCRADYTNYYPDGENEGLSIFSDKGNNLLTCYVNGRGWRTNSRTTGGFSGGTRYELYIYRTLSAGPTDTLFFMWDGYFNDSGSIGNNSFSLALKVPKSFSHKDFSALNGKRMAIDGNSGYFTSSFRGTSTGFGNIYFHKALLDSVSTGFYQGQMSGLFDADFNTVKITRGRFDHILDAQQVVW